MTARALRVKYRLTAAQAQHVDKQRVRQALAGLADYVQLEDEPVRERTARVQGMDETLELGDAVDLYLAAQDWPEEEKQLVRAEHARYAEQVVSPGRASGAGGYLPLRTEAENYGPFPELSFEYEPGITAVLGVNQDNPGTDSNGSGKSYLVNAPAVALFGHTPDGATLADVMLNDGTADRMTLTHVFRVGDETYRVRRCFSARGGGKQTLDLERLET